MEPNSSFSVWDDLTFSEDETEEASGHAERGRAIDVLISTDYAHVTPSAGAASTTPSDQAQAQAQAPALAPAVAPSDESAAWGSWSSCAKAHAPMVPTQAQTQAPAPALAPALAPSDERRQEWAQSMAQAMAGATRGNLVPPGNLVPAMSPHGNLVPLGYIDSNASRGCNAIGMARHDMR